MPGDSYCRQFGSLMLSLCDVYQALIISQVCWFYATVTMVLTTMYISLCSSNETPYGSVISKQSDSAPGLTIWVQVRDREDPPAAAELHQTKWFHSLSAAVPLPRKSRLGNFRQPPSNHSPILDLHQVKHQLYDLLGITLIFDHGLWVLKAATDIGNMPQPQAALQQSQDFCGVAPCAR